MSSITCVIPCKGRLDQIRQSVPKLLEQVGVDHRVLVVDYDCPDGALEWCRRQKHPRLDCVLVLDAGGEFNLSRARNCGNRMASTRAIVSLDADCVLECPAMLDRMVHPVLAMGARLSHLGAMQEDGSAFLGHTYLVYWRSDWMAVRGYDEAMAGHGYEDTDFYQRMRKLGRCYELRAEHCEFRVIPHDDDLRVRYYLEKAHLRSWTQNREIAERRSVVNMCGFAKFDYLYYRGDTARCCRGRFQQPLGVPSGRSSDSCGVREQEPREAGAQVSVLACDAPVLRFWAEHPRWVGEVVLYGDGRMSRPRSDGGRYKLEAHRRIILEWDRWPLEELVWDATDGLYRCANNVFTLRETSQDSQTLGRGAAATPVNTGHLGFWRDFNVEVFARMFPFLSTEYDFLEDDNPELALVSVFGKQAYHQNAHLNGREAARQWPEAVRLFFTRENVPPPLDEYDFAISFHRDIDDPRHLRWPLFLPHLHSNGFSTDSLVKREQRGVPPSERSKFCAFVAFNDGVERRNELVRQLSRYKTVDCPGKAMNNMRSRTLGEWGGVGRAWGKIKFLRDYKFVVCFENTATQAAEGYVTEKLVDAMMAGCIPLYCGDRRVGEDFNTTSFLNLDEFDGSLDDIVRRVIQIDQDDALCDQIASEPWLHGNSVPSAWRDANALQFFRRVLSFRECAVDTDSLKS